MNKEFYKAKYWNLSISGNAMLDTGVKSCFEYLGTFRIKSGKAQITIIKGKKSKKKIKSIKKDIETSKTANPSWSCAGIKPVITFLLGICWTHVIHLNKGCKIFSQRFYEYSFSWLRMLL